nr:uncharacterized protein LOC112701558 [Arachis hypogaea]
MGQLAQPMEKATNVLSGGTIPNPRKECEAISLRSGRVLEKEDKEAHVANNREEVRKGDNQQEEQLIQEALEEEPFVETLESLAEEEEGEIEECLPPKEASYIPSKEEGPPKLELKPLLPSLKYAFLEESETYPVIINASLNGDKEETLLKVLKEHKTVRGWTIGDLKGISPATYMHKILLQEDSKPVVQVQRRLNRTMKEVVKKEVMKLWEAGIISPISDSSWVSMVQVVPKKGGVTVVANNKNELIPTRTVTSWRMCIDYRRLNTATRKDQFILPFIDQILERLAGHAFYCFFDGYSSYNQIVVDPQD